MRYTGIACLAALLSLVTGRPADAASLQASPVLIDLTAPAAAAAVTLRNNGTAPVKAQVRVFRWANVGGKEELTPTTDVVASPPMVTLTPSADSIVRVVRTSKAPVAGEESYRLIVDELPDASQQKAGVVAMNVRYSIPVFFGGTAKTMPAVVWKASRRNNDLVLTATNSGDRRLRVAGLTARTANGAAVSFGAGLNGYVLGKSTMTWIAPGGAAKIGGATALAIAAQGDLGPVNAQITPIQ